MKHGELHKADALLDIHRRYEAAVFVFLFARMTVSVREITEARTHARTLARAQADLPAAAMQPVACHGLATK